MTGWNFKDGNRNPLDFQSEKQISLAIFLLLLRYFLSKSKKILLKIVIKILWLSGNGDLSVPSQQPRRHSTGYINIAELQPNLENMKIKPDVSIKLLAK